MVLIHGTNIVVDDFKTKRINRGAYIYFLSHFHRDCYKGISHLRGNERIYCSEPTQKLLLGKFPHLTNVQALKVDTTDVIFLDINKTIYVDVTLLDSNHCVGSVMMLFSGYMGTILHTGHFRFTSKMLKDLKLLYPSAQRNSKNDACSVRIDELIIDNTYCDPMFTFPKRNDAFKAILAIINQNPKGKYCIALDKIGKEELLVHIAKHFDIKVVLDQEKYDTLNLLDYYIEYFTLNPDESFLRVIKKSEIRQRLNEGCTVFVPTGWCNELCVETEKNHFVIGYSLHSNYKELGEFIRSIRPGKLSAQIDSKANKFSLKRLEKTSLNRFQQLRNMEQNGLPLLAREFCDHLQLSENYKTLIDVTILSAVQEALGLNKINTYDLQSISSLKPGAAKDKYKKSLRTGQEEIEMLHSIEIEEEAGSEADEDDGEEEAEEDEENEEQQVGAMRPNSDERELWHQFYSLDRNKFSGNEDVARILAAVGNPPPEYVPFSDLSDTPEVAEESEDEQEGGLQDRRPVQQGNMELEKDASEAEANRYRIFTGMMTLSITQRQKGETSELKEGFSMYTTQYLGSGYQIANDMNLHEVVPYSKVEQLLTRITEDSEARESVVLGWVESERNEPDSLFTKLANHMKKRGIIRRCQVDDGKVVYFLHESQIDLKIHDSATMVFLMVSI